ncbi:PREDICTED: peptidase inhibitor 16 isoform X2 [Colobus angolensis palliatus]|uniref:Peptidase inhibitor 16 n=2 Tax=Colobus angolensis palliatus TaxID=336983 RepID=A0A2K5I673_COLAP|nr:PREDICTED: peptidase inhibitor 16 isoform X2 [Colobus angolensis palliatus]
MHGSCSFLMLLLPLLLLLVATTGPAGALTDEEKRLMLELHNLYRAQVSPPASDMLHMRWDEELAAFAKAYARQCVWGHNKDRGRRGENLFAITDQGLDVPLAMEEWHHEREHYNLSAATCSPGQMCGHYTQVVWAKTERIGCGSHFCEKLQGVEETNIELLVCNYEPPGNVKGKRPYQEGTPCSQCPSGYGCKNYLCEPIGSPEDAQDLPYLVTEAPSFLATEASDSRKMGTPSLAMGIPAFLVTEVSGSLATKALPAVETQAPTSLATKDPPSMATEAPPSVTTEVPSILAAHSLPSLDEEPVNFPESTHVPIPKSADKVTDKTKVPFGSPENSLDPKMSLTGARELLPHAQEEAEAEGEAEAELPPSSEVLASVFPAQDKPGELQATLDHTGHTSSKSLPNFPNTSATANAMGGRALALQSSLPGAEGPDKPSVVSGLNPGPGHVWGPLLGLLLLLPLMLAGIF